MIINRYDWIDKNVNFKWKHSYITGMKQNVHFVLDMVKSFCASIKSQVFKLSIKTNKEYLLSLMKQMSFTKMITQIFDSSTEIWERKVAWKRKKVRENKKKYRERIEKFREEKTELCFYSMNKNTIHLTYI